MTGVTLRYKRKGADRVEGSIVVSLPAVSDEVVCDFDGIEWEPMMYRFASALQTYKDIDAGEIQRTDRLGLKPYRLSGYELELLRTDPVSAVRAMTVPDTGRRLIRAVTENAMKPLPACVDALVMAFGPTLYLRVRQEQDAKLLVECPVSAGWVPLLGEYLFLSCGYHLHVANYAYVAYGWLGITVVELLQHGQLLQHKHEHERYFLPQQWNPSGAWIKHSALQDMLKDFYKESESIQ